MSTLAILPAELKEKSVVGDFQVYEHSQTGMSYFASVKTKSELISCPAIGNAFKSIDVRNKYVICELPTTGNNTLCGVYLRETKEWLENPATGTHLFLIVINARDEFIHARCVPYDHLCSDKVYVIKQNIWIALPHHDRSHFESVETITFKEKKTLKLKGSGSWNPYSLYFIDENEYFSVSGPKLYGHTKDCFIFDYVCSNYVAIGYGQHCITSYCIWRTVTGDYFEMSRPFYDEGSLEEMKFPTPIFFTPAHIAITMEKESTLIDRRQYEIVSTSTWKPVELKFKKTVTRVGSPRIVDDKLICDIELGFSGYKIIKD